MGPFGAFQLPNSAVVVPLFWTTLIWSPTFFSFYSIRRGGATHAYTSSRDLNAVAIRGTWHGLRTAHISLDDARATLVQLSFAPPISHQVAAAADL